MDAQAPAVLITALNEADRIGATIDAIRSRWPQAVVVVADDGSTDATAARSREAGAEVVSAGRDIGKGGAATLGARRVLELDPTIVLLCDGDLGESAARLDRLVDAVAGGEGNLAVAVFSRRVGGGFGFAVGFAHWAIRNLTGLDLQAPISGQRAMDGATFRDVVPFAPRFGMEIGMTVDAYRAGRRVIEVEVDLEHRATGRSLAGFRHRFRQLADFVVVWARLKRGAR
ncbi:MAG: glycosyltransferase [Solirubrobacteraceae bacterium]|nr:glycosyltransferase [Solirubrobacteraceae bacterium]